MADTAYEIRYTDKNGLTTETHMGDSELIVARLKERGAQRISMDEIRVEDIQGYCFHHGPAGVSNDEYDDEP